MSANEQVEPLMSVIEDNNEGSGKVEDTVTHPQYYPAPSYAPLQPMANPVYSQQSTNNSVVVQQPGQTYVSAPRQPESFLFLATFTCLCCFWPTSIVALIHSCQVADRYNSGDFNGADDASRKAYFWSKVSIEVGTTIFLVSIGLYIFLVVVPLASNSSAQQ